MNSAPTCANASSMASAAAMLNDQHLLIAEILSYLVYDSQDFANFRLVSKSWNESVLPFCLHQAFKICFPQKDPVFVAEFIKISRMSYGGKLYDLTSGIQQSRIFSFFAEDSVSVQSILLVSGGFKGSSIKKVDSKSNENVSFANYCAKLCGGPLSWAEFQQIGQQALAEGMFLSVEGRKNASGKDTVFLSDNKLVPVIWTVKLPLDKALLVDHGGVSTVSLKKKRKMPNGEIGYWTYVGYNAELNDEDTMISCHVPMIFSSSQAFNLVERFQFDWSLPADRFVPLDDLWRVCQERSVREGVAIADGVVPEKLHTDLMRQIDSFTKHQIVDYHPHSNDIVRDIIHPALYSYVIGVSPVTRSVDDVPPAWFPDAEDYLYDSDDYNLGEDYWGRKYEDSLTYQWLPTYFDIGQDGSCTICDYINNLVPRSQYEDFYSSLAQLFSHALPLLESVYSYCRVVKSGYLRSEFDEVEWNETLPGLIQEKLVSLRGQRLQVVTKIVDYELKPGQSYEGVWHVEGMSHEEIVATAIYFIHRDEDITGGNLLFKRAFYRDEATYIHSGVPQCRAQEVDSLIEEGLTPLGQATTNQGRLLVFPNSHVHKVTKLQNLAEAGGKQTRRIVVFFLINPEKRIVSTREVPAQQQQVGGTMKREKALNHRLELMNERKYQKQDWNVRDIELCEH